MNAAGLEMLEADSLEQVKGQCVYQLVSPEYREAFEALTQDVFKGKSGTLEFKMIGLKGHPLWLYTHAVPLRNEKGEIVSMLAVTIDITDRRQMEEALRENEQRLKQAQQIAHVGDWEWELSTNRVWWSDELYRIYGYEPHEIAPDYGLVVRIMHPDSKEEFLGSIDAALKQDRHFEMDYRFFRKDGTEAVLHTIGHVIRDASLAPVRMFGIVQDITERKRMEQELQASESLYRNLIETTAAVAWEVDIASMRFTYISPQIMDITGFPAEQWTGFGFWAERIYPDDREYAVGFCQAQTAKGLDHVFEYRMITADNSIIWIRDVVSVVKENEKAVSLRGYLFDITESKRAEEAVRQSEEFIRNILETVDEGFIIIDREYRILQANKAYCNQAGLPSDEVIGKLCYEVSHKTNRPCYEEGEECAVRHVFMAGESHTALHRHADAEGEILYVETKAYPLRDASGNVTAVIETINNITERHLLEEERLKTQKLESIGILAGGIAHDFNNLLQGVFGYISMAKMCLDQKKKALDMLQQAEKALHMSVSLTTQLLTFSKGGRPVKKKVALYHLVENSVKFALSGSRTNYTLMCEKTLWMAEADEGQLGQVIQNIVLNADQAMPMGGEISVSAKNVRAPAKGLPALLPGGNYVELSVADSGIGIPEQYLSRIFDPYFTTKDKGSGLGLATSYSIIKNHGGLIDVKSKPGEGTTFFVYIPAIELEEEKAETIPETTAVARKGRILVMDDEELVRSIVGVMVASLGHEVEFAENGEETIARYREALHSARRFDVVILDLTIRGGKGGEETLRELLALDPGVKAIVSSGYTDSSAISEYESRGFRACLTKPYEANALRDTLNALLHEGPGCCV